MALAAQPAQPPLPPPAVVAPAPREVSFGRIAGRLPSGAVEVVVRAGGRVLAARRVRGARFDFTVSLPRRETTVRVTAVDRRGRRSTTAVPHVLGLPRRARPRGFRGHDHGPLARRIRALVRSYPATCAIYVQDLSTGAGAAWNARARFPAASTLKLAIAVEALRVLRGKPAPGSSVDSLLRAMLVDSDNGAANSVEVLIAGSTSAGGHRVNALMRSLGLVDTDMYGGYERTPQALRRRPIPLRADVQPSFGRGKQTSAYDLARLLTLVHLATEGKGALASRYRGQFTPSDARYLLYLLSQVPDRGKLGRFLPASAALLHKAGWITRARHDVGLVYWPSGALVVSVLTYGDAGPAADLLAARVARAALAALG